MKKLDWDVSSDRETIREDAINLQSRLHERRYMPHFQSTQSAKKWLENDRARWRRKTMEKYELFAGSNIRGNILEVGAGTGWASALVSKKPEVNLVYALDYDPYCVNELMPQVFKTLDAEMENINAVHGSFNNIKKNEFFDLILSFGALHHSENLEETLTQCFHALKPGGFLLASEPAEPDSMSQQMEKARMEEIDKDSMLKYGMKTKHQDNSDHYYRLSQYLSAAYNCGFNAYPFLFDRNGRQASDRIFTERLCFDGYAIIPHKPYFGGDAFDRLMLRLEKPKDLEVSEKDLAKYKQEHETGSRGWIGKRILKRTLPEATINQLRKIKAVPKQ